MRGSILARAAGCALAAFSFAGLASAADIADLAPRSSFLVLSIDNWPALKGDLERSGVLGLWKEKTVSRYVETFMRSMTDGDMEEITGYLADIGISLDDLPPLGTTVGAAFFDGPRQDEAGRPIADERMTHFVVVAELNGGQADDGRDLWQMVEEALERADDEGHLELEPAPYGDGDLFRVIRRSEVEEWDEEAWENWDPEGTDADENMPAPKMVELVETQYVGRAGGHMVFTSSYDVARDTVDRLEGRERGDTVGDVREFTIGRGGKAPGAHAYAVLLPQTLFRENALDLLPLPVDDENGDAARAVLDVLGLSRVNAVSMSVEAGTPGAVLEAQMVVHVPEKRGLFALVGGPALPGTPPSFVGPDAHSFAAYRVNFDGIVPLARQAINALPDAPEIDGMMMQFEQFASTVEPLLNAVGPEVTQVETLRRPFSAKSEGMVVAISMRDAEPVRNALNTLGGMAGLMPRDFAGSQIWESQFIPAVVGLGSGHVFIGMRGAESVEKAMLSAAQPDAPKLADDARFARARRALADGGVMLGWQDLRAVLEYSAWTAEHFDEVLRAQASEYGMAKEEIEEYVNMMREHVPEVARTPLPVDALTRVLGDVITQMRSTERGFEGRVVVLPPAR